MVAPITPAPRTATLLICFIISPGFVWQTPKDIGTLPKDLVTWQKSHLSKKKLSPNKHRSQQQRGYPKSNISQDHFPF